jgi:hypothetical protein
LRRRKSRNKKNLGYYSDIWKKMQKLEVFASGAREVGGRDIKQGKLFVTNFQSCLAFR